VVIIRHPRPVHGEQPLADHERERQRPRVLVIVEYWYRHGGDRFPVRRYGIRQEACTRVVRLPENGIVCVVLFGGGGSRALLSGVSGRHPTTSVGIQNEPVSKEARL